MTRKTKYCAGISAMILLLGLTACNSGKNTGNEYQPETEQPGASAELAGYDACVLVTKADAEAALGEAVDPAKGQTSPLGSKTCAYSATSLSSMKRINVYLGPLRLGAEQDLWNAQKKLWQDKGIQPAAGLGKDAYFDPNGNLVVLTSKAIVTISADGFRGQTAKTDKAGAEKTLAQKALSRM